MATNDFFYNWREIKEMKELIRTGEPIARIAEREHARFNTTSRALRMKMYKLSKSTFKIREWEGSKKVRKATKGTDAEKGVLVPEGTTFEGTSKKVMFYKDHFRIYF